MSNDKVCCLESNFNCFLEIDFVACIQSSGFAQNAPLSPARFKEECCIYYFCCWLVFVQF